MKISIISGSHRKPSQSEKVARYLAKALDKSFDDIEPWVYTLAENPLPLWDQT
ncbi:MAG: NAD(P)H-dependent oxidoreductase, partial [Gammaproteobacteria bacterium]|nr:NAD(P)H-dependent oxidoreductase [Gammaproteobacteria bacterium]